MRILNLSAWLLVSVIFPLHFSAQVSQDDLDVVLGDPFRNPCVVPKDSGLIKTCVNYPFSDDFYVGVGLDRDQKVLQIGLFPKDSPDDFKDSLSAARQRQQFLKTVERLHSFGSLLFSCHSNSNNEDKDVTWLVYETVSVSTSETTRIGNEYFPTLTTVYLLFGVSGTKCGIE